MFPTFYEYHTLSCFTHYFYEHYYQHYFNYFHTILIRTFAVKLLIMCQLISVLYYFYDKES